MVVHLGVGEVTLLLALGDEFLELGLLLCGLCSHGALDRPREGRAVTAQGGPALVVAGKGTDRLVNGSRPV